MRVAQGELATCTGHSSPTISSCATSTAAGPVIYILAQDGRRGISAHDCVISLRGFRLRRNEP
jgi:hypothetical protein